jgi:hypothetical protein
MTTSAVSEYLDVMQPGRAGEDDPPVVSLPRMRRALQLVTSRMLAANLRTGSGDAFRRGPIPYAKPRRSAPALWVWRAHGKWHVSCSPRT